MHSTKTWTDQKSDFLPLANIKLRARGKRVRDGVERYVDRSGGSRDQLVDSRRVDGFSAGNRPSPAEDAEIYSQAEPWFRGDSEIGFESTLRQIASRTDHVVEPGDKR